jgi:protein SCO1/2
MRCRSTPAGLALLLLAATRPVPAAADPGSGSDPRPALAGAPAAARVDIDERLGAAVPRDLIFTDQKGRRVRLGDLLGGGRPVVLTLAYFRCPMLCDLVLQGISHGIRTLGWRPGRDYVGVTASIDPGDVARGAELKQAAVLQAIGEPDAGAGWPFLVGDERNIRALADSVGFRYAYDPTSRQYAHPAVVVVLTPEGKVSRYLYGVEFRLLDLRLALTEASRGKVGTIVDRVLLTCFRYDPTVRRYGFYVSAVLKGGAGTVLLAVALGLGVLWRRDAQRTRAAGGRRC